MTFPNLHSAIKYSIRPNPTEYFQCIYNKTCVNVPIMQRGERFKTLPSVINLTSEHPLAITLANISFHTVIEVTFEAGFGIWICHCWDSSICVITRSYLSFVYPITDWVTEEHYSLFFFFFFWFFFSELGTEPRALRFLGKRSTTELNPQPLQSFF